MTAEKKVGRDEGSGSRSASSELVRRRFEAKFSKGDGCWEWTAALNSRGYGWFVVNDFQWLAHRFAWRLANGPIPEGLVVRHRCDNRKCVRPDHLEIGTQKDNLADMYARGRARFNNSHAPRGPRPSHWRPQPGTREAIERRYGGGEDT